MILDCETKFRRQYLISPYLPLQRRVSRSALEVEGLSCPLAARSADKGSGAGGEEKR